MDENFPENENPYFERIADDISTSSTQQHDPSYALTSENLTCSKIKVLDNVESETTCNTIRIRPEEENAAASFHVAPPECETSRSNSQHTTLPKCEENLHLVKSFASAPSTTSRLRDPTKKDEGDDHNIRTPELILFVKDISRSKAFWAFLGIATLGAVLSKSKSSDDRILEAVAKPASLDRFLDFICRFT